MSFNIKKAWAALIEKTNNPMMPIILQDTYNNLDRLGVALAAKASKKKTGIYWNTLLTAWDDDDELLETVSAEPEFIIALAGMLCESLRAYVHNATKEDDND